MTEANQTNETEGQHYKTAEELKITQEQFCALVKVRESLSDGSIQFHALCGLKNPHDSLFNMRLWRRETSCGTIGCIAGWAEALTPGLSFVGTSEQGQTGLSALFYPKQYGPAHTWDELKPQHAVRAIDNYLKTGNPNWKEAVAKG